MLRQRLHEWLHHNICRQGLKSGQVRHKSTIDEHQPMSRCTVQEIRLYNLKRERRHACGRQLEAALDKRPRVGVLPFFPTAGREITLSKTRRRTIPQAL